MEDSNNSTLLAFKECIKAFSKAQHQLANYTNANVEDLQKLLDIEKGRLSSWGEAIGIDKANHIVKLLQQSLQYLRELEMLSEKKDPRVSPDIPLLGLSLTEASREKAEAVWDTLQQERAQLLIQNLTDTNNELFSSLPKLQNQQLVAELRLFRLSQLVEMRELKDLLKFQLTNPRMDDDGQIHQLYRLKEQRMRLDMAKGGRSVSESGKDIDDLWAPQLRKQLLVRRDRSSSVAFQSGQREIASYNNEPVFVDWKAYDPETAIGREGLEIFERVQRIAAMLHTEEHRSLRALRCLGYFEDDTESRYCFVYRLPSGANPRKVPVSLLEYIESKWQPSLTSRMKVAKDLVTSILRLHGIGWLHKGLRSENVIFFPKDDGSPRTLEDFHLVGFEYARKQGPDEFSEKLAPNPTVDIYRHPHCLRSDARFTKKFEYYSLGIILFEIARWSSVHRILQKEVPMHRRNVKQSEIGKVKELLLDDNSERRFAAEIEFRMGTKYKNAMYTCLTGDLGLEDDYCQDGESARKLLESFATKVVKELTECSI